MIVLSGRNVARPPSTDLRYLIARFASSSVSVTMFCIAEPRAVSIATPYSFGTEITRETGPHIP